MSDSPFLEFLHRGDGAVWQTDDILPAVLPLFRQVAAWHEQALVAPLQGLATLSADEMGALHCDGAPTSPAGNPTRVDELQRPIVTRE
jgi:hypothetical protein